jgi:hypothetical protein
LKDALARLLPRVARARAFLDPQDTQGSGTDRAENSANGSLLSERAALSSRWWSRPPSDSQTSSLGNASAHAVWEEACRTCTQQMAATEHQIPLNLRVMARIGGLVYAERDQLDGKALHIVNGSQLVAVLDSQQLLLCVRQALPPGIDPARLSTRKMTPAASGMPSGFVPLSLRMAIWHYGLYDAESLLDIPAKIASHHLQLRRLPAVAPADVTSLQLEILRTLLSKNLSLEELCAHLQVQVWQVCHALAALVLTHSVKLVEPRHHSA